jgi:hypothetical protein
MFTAFGDRSRRGRTQPPRPRKPRGKLAPGVILPGTPRYRELARQQETPTQKAKNRLYKALGDIPNVSDDLRRQLVEEMESLEQLPNMNMDTLATALMFLHNLGTDDVTPDDFTDNNLKPVLSKNILPDPKLSPTDRERIYLKTKITILRYLTAVATMRQQRQQLFQAVQ